MGDIKTVPIFYYTQLKLSTKKSAPFLSKGAEYIGIGKNYLA